MPDDPRPLPSLPDESLRPKAPPIAGLDPAQRSRGRRLAAIHRMHLADLDHLAQVMRAIAHGAAPAGQLAKMLPALDLDRNRRLFGTLCGQECRVLTFHHMAEDHEIFPYLAAHGSAGLRAVIDRLQAEHEVIHALIERLQADADRLATDPGADRFAEAAASLQALDRAVRSHFGYEETELEEALALHPLL